MSFTIFQNQKKPFQAIKTRSSKTRKIDNFPKGLTHRFGPKMAIFPNSFFQAIQARNMSFTYFSKGVNPQFWSKNGHFSIFFFLGNIGQEKFPTIFLKKKMPFQAIKTRSSKSRIIDIFPRGLTHGFCRKMAFFPLFFFVR